MTMKVVNLNSSYNIDGEGKFVLWIVQNWYFSLTKIILL